MPPMLQSPSLCEAQPCKTHSIKIPATAQSEKQGQFIDWDISKKRSEHAYDSREKSNVVSAAKVLLGSHAFNW